MSFKPVLRALSLVLLSACFSSVALGAITSMKKGNAGSEVQGSAGPSGSQGASGDLETCAKPMGAMAVVEPQDYVMQALGRYGLGSPVGLIRLMIQQSNCFIVVERGMGMQNLMQERALMESGQLRQSSNMGGGQMVAADFILTPAVVFSESNSGGLGGAIGGMFGSSGRVIGGLAGGLKFKEAQTSMLLADARSGIQVAAAEGSASKADFSLGGAILGKNGGGALGGYTNTNEGKVIASSLLDNYNGIVSAVRGNPSLQRDVGTLMAEAAKDVKAGAVFNEGDILYPKISKVKLMDGPASSSNLVATLTKADEMIFMGEEQDGFVYVESGEGGGWVKKLLVTR
jgi:curli biogenesis system outer membrane secretion channel CsgG